jgi:diguanylate cyclase (GGDEF)-like protein/PAS domain S-box-containing protein
MRRVKQWMDQLLDSSHIGVLVVDKERNNLFVNERLCEMFAYTKEELLQTNAEIFHLNREAFINFADIAFKSVLTGTPLSIDYQFKRSDGSYFWVHIAGDPIKNKEEVLWTMVDITPRVEAKLQEKELQAKSNQLAQMVEQTHDAVISTDLQGNILTWNRGAQKLFGYTQEEILNKNVSILHLEEDLEKLQKRIGILMLKGEFNNDIRILTKAKKTITVSFSLSLLHDANGNPSGMVGYAVDIHEKVKAQKQLEETNYNLQIYLDAIDKIGIGLFVVDDDFTVRFMNKTMQKWFGNQTGKICYSSVAGLDEPCPYCKLHEVIHENQKVTYNPTTDMGESFEIVATSIKNSDGTSSKMEFIRNVTDEKKAQVNLKNEKEKLNYQAHHDALTGLPNRILFNNKLDTAILKAQKENKKVALIFIDLDHFKEINDSLGHDVGDKILTTVTTRLQEILQEKDTLARLGGDEFTIILEDLTNLQEVSLISSNILKILSEVINIEGNKLYVSSSIGISIYPDDGLSAQNLLKFADSAMYKAKDVGRNNYQYYNTKMTEVAVERIKMETDLRDALKKEEFVVYYQPQVNGVTNKIIGMEALVRWNHPKMGLVSPAKFIPLAEITGLIVELDRFVMRTAMKQIREWYDKGLNPGVLAMNLAVKQLQQVDFIKTLTTLLETSKCKPQWIELEVTESQIMRDPETAISLLKSINELGIELAVDDFGTGYSSLSYLKKLPIDKLKIDQAFIRDLPYDEEDASIARAVIALAKSLNLHIIAEGVETQAQKDFIVENGCENIQGYFYSKPVPANEMELLLKKESFS